MSIRPKDESLSSKTNRCGSVLSYLLLGGVGQHPGDEDAVRDEFQPGVHEAGSFGGSQDVEGVAAHMETVARVECD